MPKFPAIPQLSIVVPVTNDLAVFERSLISVLENVPEGSEIVVPHDGTYDDPYQLCDEVRFATADASDLPRLIAAGAEAARGRLVHVIAEGIRATPGWTEAAVECFDEHFDCGAVTPCIQHSSSGNLIACGWTDTFNRLGSPRTKIDQKGRVGCYLQASFWRRELLRSLGRAITCDHADQASAVYSRMARKAGWSCEVAPESILQCDMDSLPWDQCSFGRGMRLEAVARHFGRSSSGAWFAAAANVFRPKAMIESLGGLAAPMVASQLARAIRADEVVACDDESAVLRLPQRQAAKLRNAA